jgi:hypothetical protein
VGEHYPKKIRLCVVETDLCGRGASTSYDEVMTQSNRAPEGVLQEAGKLEISGRMTLQIDTPRPFHGISPVVYVRMIDRSVFQ